MTERETRTVLIVDGSPTMLYYHGILLKRLEYAVITAATPEDALKIMEQRVPSLILTATFFPSMNGVDFIKTVKGKDRTRAVPIIVLTAEDHASVKSACLNAGCVAYFSKPVDPNALYRAIQAATEPTPRENIRINTSLKTVLANRDRHCAGDRIEYATANSEKGAYIRMLDPEETNELIPITIHVTDREIRAKAIVLYTHSIKQGAFQEPGMGLKFVEISDEDRAYLRNFIKDQLTSDILIDPSQ